METIKTIGINSPIILASIALLLVAICRSGREKRSQLFLIGAIGLCLAALITPIIYSVVMPMVIEKIDPDQISSIFMIIHFITNVLWALPLVAIAAGVYARSSESKDASL